MNGIITNVQRFCGHDGPGLRTTVFLKGCPLRCEWCHNPETWGRGPQPQLVAARCVRCGECAAICTQGCHSLDAPPRFDSFNCAGCLKCVPACPANAIETCGEVVSAREVVDRAARDMAFYGAEGGITLSGGEPMLQPDFAIEVLTLAKAAGMSTCVETSGYFSCKHLSELCAVTDHFLWDIKDTDPVSHLNYTGVRPNIIWENLAELALTRAADIRIRAIIVGGVNDELSHIDRVIDMAHANHVGEIELMPFHPYGSSKRGALGRAEGRVMGAERVPDDEFMKEARERIALSL